MKTTLAALGILLIAGCSTPAPDTAKQGSARVRLKPVSSPLGGDAIHRTVYVPIYSSVYWSARQKPVELAATLSVRNVSPGKRLIVESVSYYDSHGAKIREYLESPGELGPLASVEFVVETTDTTGGPGANFLVRLSAEAGIDEPLVEAVMVGQYGNAGLSFTSPGRVVTNPERR